MEKYYFYVLKSLKDGNLYKVFTKDIKKRLNEHNSGKVRSTKNRKPFILVYKEEFQNKNEVIKKEKYYKSLKGGKELNKIISNV